MTEKVYGAIARAEALVAGHLDWPNVTEWPLKEEEMKETNAKELEVFQGLDEQWYWHAKAGNGEIVAQGEGHPNHEGAKAAAEGAFPGVPVNDAA